ncbi:DUF3040 domain-containing protein [Lipingzhangella sp. LS1_29]|uniref:DUF3040 domain-containing protein n=1 Tax=Lipingzhangella rawalii TaxID=2055835 RepID=A0ABU2H288_9ACTN|nr:DUF3040 domain-containing protein [Lipingzhangella rawalii]MDS1269411.1 DUF3040 domain-containing protein [Lipingzhangella rawalii]
MPLSEHEQRMLDQIERALYAEDPKFANTVRETNPQVHYKRRIVKASIGFVVGVILMMTGVMIMGVVADQLVLGGVLSMLGFLVMLICTVRGMSEWRRATGGAPPEAADPGPSGKQQRRSQRPGMMDRLEERWRKRQEGE